MAETREILHTAFVIKKAYDSIWDDISERFELTHAEIDVIAFLSNNPMQDTASNIVEYRMIAKSHVSKAVERLIARGMLVGNKDPKDKRQIHLMLTDEASTVVGEIRKRQLEFKDMIIDGVTEEEIALFRKISEKIVENAASLIEENA